MNRIKQEIDDLTPQQKNLLTIYCQSFFEYERNYIINELLKNLSLKENDLLKEKCQTKQKVDEYKELYSGHKAYKKRNIAFQSYYEQLISGNKNIEIFLKQINRMNIPEKKQILWIFFLLFDEKNIFESNQANIGENSACNILLKARETMETYFDIAKYIVISDDFLNNFKKYDFIKQNESIFESFCSKILTNFILKINDEVIETINIFLANHKEKMNNELIDEIRKIKNFVKEYNNNKIIKEGKILIFPTKD